MKLPHPLERAALALWRELPLPQVARYALLRRLNPSYMVGTVALIRNPQGELMLLEHTYRKIAPWGLPGGWIQANEVLEEALRRELREETGMEVEVGALLAARA